MVFFRLCVRDPRGRSFFHHIQMCAGTCLRISAPFPSACTVRVFFDPLRGLRCCLLHAQADLALTDPHLACCTLQWSGELQPNVWPVFIRRR